MKSKTQLMAPVIALAIWFAIFVFVDGTSTASVGDRLSDEELRRISEQTFSPEEVRENSRVSEERLREQIAVYRTRNPNPLHLVKDKSASWSWVAWFVAYLVCGIGTVAFAGAVLGIGVLFAVGAVSVPAVALMLLGAIAGGLIHNQVRKARRTRQRPNA